MNLENVKYIIVGAGFFGAVIAERIANDKGERVLVIDKRPHWGGNCYSEIDSETGIEFHKYGTHIFHTSSEKVWKYINSFTDFNGYCIKFCLCTRTRYTRCPSIWRQCSSTESI
jgi:UDP-galactopyranose mutase